MAQAVQINPGILSWARASAGLSLEEAALKLGLKTTAKVSAAEKLRQAENGERPIGQGMLEKAAATYRRPLVTFYLPHPPARAERSGDFRTVQGGASPRDDAMLDALLRDLRARQQMLREALLDEEDHRPLPFVAASRPADGARMVAASIRSTLSVSPTDQRRAKGTQALFALLRAAVERAGIYVLLLGDLGSHQSDIGEEVFRGIALADDVAPFIIINDNDATPARSFTLLHELAHVWIGASGVSGPLRGIPTNAVERFCNEVAGALLLPDEALAGMAPPDDTGFAPILALTEQLARAWNVSQGVVTFRFLERGWIPEALAGRLFQAFADRWQAQKQRDRASRDPDESGPGYYDLRRSRLGAGLLATVRRAFEAEVLTHTKAARILGVAPGNVSRLLHERLPSR